MNTFVILTGILSCFLLMLSVTHAYTLTDKKNTADPQWLMDRPLAMARNKFFSMNQYDDDSMINSEEDDEHELEKRRFNAWAGKRSLVGKRRFNAWAGRR
ncbi:unnamed protein product [Rotaria socialis]|uniref:Uncharacterized protein n=1 Tax=Rotaria socialis TaxID=392032 RepID=A0A817TZG7_9BILA|nr:unnamed protein product [Rotaria socialis]CAF3319648.1 unnamed protein product [Rotaria socialis]CAF3510602.1 unnamed protein product [Rotaria socialis]CAF3616018.1 unnamed protein product [Rotaria socialis]CAF3685981.1 unnamed protein product [Rotaria socialis]